MKPIGVDERVPWNRIQLVTEDKRPFCYLCISDGGSDHARGPFFSEAEALGAARVDPFVISNGSCYVARIEYMDHDTIADQCSDAIIEIINNALGTVSLPHLSRGMVESTKSDMSYWIGTTLDLVWYPDDDTLTRRTL